jgi:hypothetical protein
LCSDESWERCANSDGEHEETSSYLQHLQLLGKRVAQGEQGRWVIKWDHSAALTGFTQLLE